MFQAIVSALHIRDNDDDDNDDDDDDDNNNNKLETCFISGNF